MFVYSRFSGLWSYSNLSSTIVEQKKKNRNNNKKTVSHSICFRFNLLSPKIIILRFVVSRILRSNIQSRKCLLPIRRFVSIYYCELSGYSSSLLVNEMKNEIRMSGMPYKFGMAPYKHITVMVRNCFFFSSFYSLPSQIVTARII